MPSITVNNEEREFTDPRRNLLSFVGVYATVEQGGMISVGGCDRSDLGPEHGAA